MNIPSVVEQYFTFRKYVVPDADQAFKFLVSEIGELADKLVHNQAEWVRNNPQNKNDDVKGEIGDVLMMLTALAMALGTDPLKCMLEKFARKGFAPEGIRDANEVSWSSASQAWELAGNIKKEIDDGEFNSSAYSFTVARLHLNEIKELMDDIMQANKSSIKSTTSEMSQEVMLFDDPVPHLPSPGVYSVE